LGYGDWYLEEVLRLGGLDAPESTGPRNRAEAIAYLWQGWMVNYNRFGEPPPWYEFK
jgi:hypothetical protein